MKQKICFLYLLTCLFSANAWATDAGFRFIKTRGEVLCGTDLNAGTFANKDEAGYWRGIDADLCRVFSTAIFGRSDRFKLVDVKANQANAAIANNKIDIMLGGAPYSASNEIRSLATPVDIIYYDKQMFLARNADKATSMEDYKGQKVCVVNNSDDQYNLEEYNARYNLDLKPLFFSNNQRAKEAFLLNRCTLLTGNALFLINVSVIGKGWSY